MTFYTDHLITSPIIKLALQSLIQDDQSFLFHCHAGKCRTGGLCAIFLWMLEFNEDAIITEYLRLDQRVVDDDGNKSMREDHQFSEGIIQKREPMLQVIELNII